MKSKPVSIRFTADELAMLNEQAVRDRCTVSKLIRERALNPYNVASKGSARRIIPALCKLSTVITKLPSSNTKDKLIEREAELWQSIK